MNRLANENPFGHQLIDRLNYRFPDGQGWQSNVDRLIAMGCRAAVIGKRGTGKSTLLRQLHHHVNDGDPDFVERMWPDGRLTNAVLLNVWRFGTDPVAAEYDRRQQREHVQSKLRQVGPETLLLVDGVERLTWLDRQRLIRMQASVDRCAGLIVNLHRPALWLGLKAWVTTAPSVDLLQDLLRDLDVASPQVTERANKLFEIKNQNIREVLRALYDDWATRRI